MVPNSALLSLLLLSLVFPTRIAAEEIFRFEGLEIPCESCRVHADNTCEIKKGGVYELLSCESAAAYLLKQNIASANDTVKSPSLIRFLLYRRRTAEIAEPALELLFRDEKAIPEIKRQGHALLTSYCGSIADLAAKGKISLSSELTQTFWSYPGRDEATFRLKALIVANGRQYSFADLLSELSANDPTADLASIRAIKSAVEQKNIPWTHDIDKIEELITTCVDTNEQWRGLCDTEKIKHLSDQAARTYAIRLKSELLLRPLLHSDDPIAILETISRTEYETLHTPAMHDAVLHALTSALSPVTNDATREIVNNNFAEQLALFAAADEEISDKVNELRNRTNEKQPLLLALAFAVICCGAFVVGGLRLKRRRKCASEQQTAHEECIDRLNSAERRTLKESLEYFGLSYEVQKEELTKAFRQKVRVHHPDIHGGDIVAFNELTDRYNKAKDLIERR